MAPPRKIKPAYARDDTRPTRRSSTSRLQQNARSDASSSPFANTDRLNFLAQVCEQLGPYVGSTVWDWVPTPSATPTPSVSTPPSAPCGDNLSNTIQSKFKATDSKTTNTNIVRQIHASDDLDLHASIRQQLCEQYPAIILNSHDGVSKSSRASNDPSSDGNNQNPASTYLVDHLFHPMRLLRDNRRGRHGAPARQNTRESTPVPEENESNRDSDSLSSDAPVSPSKKRARTSSQSWSQQTHCGFCKLTFSDLQKVQLHKDLVHPLRYVCNRCHGLFSTRGHLNKHQRFHCN